MAWIGNGTRWAKSRKRISEHAEYNVLYLIRAQILPADQRGLLLQHILHPAACAPHFPDEACLFDSQ